MSIFFPILQQGFMVRVHGGFSVKKILCKDLNIEPNLIEKRVKTIFLNQKPVDDIDRTIIKKNATLALSSALPGLAGATMRMNGVLSSFRKNISHDIENIENTPLNNEGNEGHDDHEECFITLKLFNLMIKDLGPYFLSRGIWLKSNILRNLFKNRLADLRKGCQFAKLDGKKIDLDKLFKIQWDQKESILLLKIDFSVKSNM